MAESGLFAVTTRSRLKGPWLFPPMMIASLRVRRQLAHDSSVVRWASIVAGPSEFWTITVWRSRHDMQEFMRSGAHDEIMWLFSRWLRSFWLMRWRPGPLETGQWKGITMAQSEPAYEKPPLDSGRQAALEKALEHLPRLREAVGADGAVTYENTPFARRRRAEVGGAAGAVVHIATSPLSTVGAVLALRRLRREAAGGTLLRAVVGVGRPGETYLLVLWRDRESARRFLASPALEATIRAWPRCWANEWLPENEFGHWDGMRLRRSRERYTISMPPSALEALRADDVAEQDA